MAPLVRDCPPKPAKGSHWLRGRERRAERKAHEDREMTAARKRDMAITHGCRWPRCPFMAKKPRLEVMHVFEHRKAGGNPDGSRTLRHLLMLGCFIHHDLIDRGEAAVTAQTALGTDGPCDFKLRNEAGDLEIVASEQRIGVSSERSVR